MIVFTKGKNQGIDYPNRHRDSICYTNPFLIKRHVLGKRTKRNHISKQMGALNMAYNHEDYEPPISRIVAQSQNLYSNTQFLPF